MKGLQLRPEFLKTHIGGTAIELDNPQKRGATQVDPKDFLEITYPTSDVIETLRAVRPRHPASVSANENAEGSGGRPVVLVGQRGIGKSHLLAVVYHAFTSPEATRDWLTDWAPKLQRNDLADLVAPTPRLVIAETMHQQRYKYLWDLVFDRHPRGAYVRGLWDAQAEKKTPVPGAELINELINHTPFMLILDEFQTWFDGLADTDRDKARAWAFNFIQILSEAAAKWGKVWPRDHCS